MREVPPTAGLPLQWRDFLPGHGSFEADLAAFLNAPEIQFECSGTAAQIVALTALKKISSRSKVILPAYTCPLVALAVLHCGLEPVLCDLRPSHFDLDHEQLAALCDESTLAIVATHLGGRVADLAPVLEIARRCGAYVIEDAAQSLGATWQGQPVGLAGDAGFYSLAVGKGLTTYEGGVLLTRDETLRRQLRTTADEIAPFKWGWELRRSLELLGYAALYQPWGLPLAYGLPLRRALKRGELVEAVGDDFSEDIPLHRLGSWRKTVGAHALQRLPAFLHASRQQAMRRLETLNSIPGITVIADTPGTQGVWPFFMVLMRTPEARDAVLDQLWTAGLGVSRLYIHALPDYAYLAAKLPQTGIPNARTFAASMLTISNSPWLGEADFAAICSVLQK